MNLVQGAFFTALAFEGFAKAPAGPPEFEKSVQQEIERLLLLGVGRARVYNQSLEFLDKFTRKGESARKGEPERGNPVSNKQNKKAKTN